MSKQFEKMCEQLEAKIVDSYEQGISMPEAEKLAGEFIYAQLQVSSELKKADLDSRMRKSGVKAIRAAIYTESAKPSLPDGKKPTEAALAALVDSNELVSGEQNGLDKAEVERDNLERYYSIFQNAHIHFRGIAKGSFGG